jgi:hypothetical protein
MKHLGAAILAFLLVLPIVFSAEAQHTVNGNRVTFDIVGNGPVLINIRADGTVGTEGGYAWIKVDGPTYTIDLPFVPATQAIEYGVKEASGTSWVVPATAVSLGVASTGKTPGYDAAMAGSTGADESSSGSTGSGSSSGTSVTATDPCPEIIPEAQQKKHPLKFYFEQDFVESAATGASLEEKKANFLTRAQEILPFYVEDLNCILRKNTNRRMTFAPESGVVLMGAADPNPYDGQTGAFTTETFPQEGFEIRVHVQKSQTQQTYGLKSTGGHAAIDSSGAGAVAYDYTWGNMYDPRTLTGTYDNYGNANKESFEFVDYWTQINTILHEAAHIFGAGVSEYYSLAYTPDNTPELPLNYEMNILRRTFRDDPYWSGTPDRVFDPLYNLMLSATGIFASEEERPKTLAALREKAKYSALTAAIFNGQYRIKLDSTIPDITKIKIRIVDQNGASMSGARVKVFRVDERSTPTYALVLDVVTDALGEVELDWRLQGDGTSTTNYFTDRNNVRLIKVSKENYQPSAKWITLFDAQEAKVIRGESQWIVELKMQQN